MYIASRLLCLLLLLCVSLLPACPAPRAEETELRALLIGCDHFLTVPSTAPAAAENIDMLRGALMTDARGYERIVCESDSIASPEALAAAVAAAFQDAGPEDLSLVYLSTHGFYSPGQDLSTCALFLSDGTDEARVTAPELKEILDAVPGRKMLILDACNSGAFIGKGLSLPNGGPGVFADPDYRVLCSAGGSEESWYWRAEDDGDPNVQYGASYFATVLTHMLSPLSPADLNRDGLVTLSEARDCLHSEYAASTPQVYPEDEDDFVLYSYDDGGAESRDTVIRSLILESSVITSADPILRFTFTQTAEAEVYYQLVYRREGAWDFNSVQMIADQETSDDAGTPGMKRRELTLLDLNGDSYGYLMLLVITKPLGHAELQASALISVQSENGMADIACLTDSAFRPGLGQEASILVLHERPCSLTAAILDADGQAVRYLCFSEPSRPQSFAGTPLVWDGRKTDGTLAEPGRYTVRVTAYSGSSVQTVTADGPEVLP